MQEGYHWWAIASLLFVSIVNLVLGVIVIQSGRSARHWWFLSLAIFSSLWIITNALFAITSGSIQELLALASYGSAAILAMSFLGFVCVFTGYRVRSLVAWLYVLAGLAVAVISVIPGMLLVSVTPELRLETNGAPLIPYGFFVVGSLVAGMAVLAWGCWSTRKQRRLQRQVIVVLAGAVVAGAVGIACNLVAPMLGNYALVQVGPLGILVFIVVTAYAVVRHGMFDVRLAVARTIMYTLSFAVLSALYIILVYGASVLLMGMSAEQYGSVVSPLNVILALVLAFLFQPVKNFFDQLTNSIFYHGQYDYDAAARKLGQILSHNTDMRLLLKEVSRHIGTSLKAEQIFFYIKDHGLVGTYNTRKSILPEDDLALIEQWFDTNCGTYGAIMVGSEVEEEARRVLLSHKTQIITRLSVGDRTLGYMFMGEHRSRGYSTRDIRLLKTISNELSIAIQNTISIEEIKDLNDSLKQRIDDATKELRSSNRQLQKLDKAKDEFISMASHQLRTPLTSIKGYLDMVLDGDLGKITATQRTVLSEAYISSERMVTLINDFLNVSRLQTGKFMIDKRQVDMAEMVKEQATMLEVMARQHDLKMDLQISPDLPLIMADGDKIRQVVLNMIDNAIYYSKPATTIDIMLAKDGKDIVFSVKDTGIGVPESEKAGLFGKFFRASNARKKRPDGTGVGLFLARKVVLSHGGDIIFWSKEDKGSIFGFRLPIGTKTD